MSSNGNSPMYSPHQSRIPGSIQFSNNYGSPKHETNHSLPLRSPEEDSPKQQKIFEAMGQQLVDENELSYINKDNDYMSKWMNSDCTSSHVTRPRQRVFQRVDS
jgi:hypothetical protein